jgi:ergothioneine biosynthesis protein EgtB
MIPLADKPAATTSSDLALRYATVRSLTAMLCEPLSPEDCAIQSMPSASPVRWHLAHTSWFFETFLLRRDPAYCVFDEHFEVLFNSYYNSVGEQFPRARRGLLSRPSLAAIHDYRRHVDEAVARRFERGRIQDDAELATIVEWGIQHEQQHQELILTDVKHLFSLNPLYPAYRRADATGERRPAVPSWMEFDGGIHEIGFASKGFAYDNESPRHRVFLEPFELASRPVASGEFLRFVEDGGYEQAEFWLSEGWHAVQEQRLTQPLYWRKCNDAWYEFTLAGLRPLDVDAPASHLSYFEADAYARWAGARLPTEAEWEVAALDVPVTGHFVDTLLADGRAIHPSAAHTDVGGLSQTFGDIWEWTASPYVAYPGYRPPAGALGEYNGKFMCNQYVLRGGSCATPSGHIRPTYRNFFPPDAQWQFSGVRLAR